MPQPEDRIVRTAADELFDLVKKSKKVSVEEASKVMKIPLPTVQALVDFLVEEKVFGIEYKFTTPYVYLYKENLTEAKKREKSFTKGLVTKEEFYEKVKKRNIPYEYIEGLWRKYLKQNIINLRQEFVTKSNEKKIQPEKMEELWQKYLSYL